MVLEEFKKYLTGEWKCMQYDNLHFKFDGENVAYCINNKWSTLHESKLYCITDDLSEVKKIRMTPLGFSQNYVYVIPPDNIDIVDFVRADVLHFQRQLIKD
jgi:hypothetical protein